MKSGASESKTTSNVVQQIVGTSLRSLRITKGLRAYNRYAVFADRRLDKEDLFPQSLNELRSMIYTFSIINNDLRAFVPAPFLNTLSSKALSLGKAIGDYNAVKNTVLQVATKGGLAGIGERAIRRVGGRMSGQLLRNVVPNGSNVFSRAIFRGVRSTVGANLTIEMDRLLKGSPKNADTAVLTANFAKFAKAGQVNGEMVGLYIKQMLELSTPVDSGALFDSITMRKGRGGEGGSDYIIKVGNVQPMPDPRVPYPWVVEFGINEGFNKGTAKFDLLFPIPRRFLFLKNVTGPRPPGDNFYNGRYDGDNRSPYQRSSKNYGKGAMMRTALYKTVMEAKKYTSYDIGLPKYKSNPWKELVWDAAEQGINGYSTRSGPTPF